MPRGGVIGLTDSLTPAAPRLLKVTDIPDPEGLPVSPVTWWGALSYRLELQVDCNDESHLGGIAVKASWASGVAILRYRCPDK